MMAAVGQAGMQALQLPQCALARVSISSGRSVSTSPKKKYEPAVRLIRLVCLPIQPNPALRASAFSSTGPESTNTR